MSKLFNEMKFFMLQGPEIEATSKIIIAYGGQMSSTVNKDSIVLVTCRKTHIIKVTKALGFNVFSASFIYDSVKQASRQQLSDYQIVVEASKDFHFKDFKFSQQDIQNINNYIRLNTGNPDSDSYWFVALYNGLDVPYSSEVLYEYYCSNIALNLETYATNDESTSSERNEDADVYYIGRKRRCLEDLSQNSIATCLQISILNQNPTKKQNIQPAFNNSPRHLVIAVNSSERSVYDLKDIEKKSKEINITEEFEEFYSKCKSIVNENLSKSEVLGILTKFNGDIEKALNYYQTDVV
ncbi:unnamed protein product [Blepharisma stoltei]|uniref:BRCT domain-containing protein n=1 Tax=Blepharisma stoltei TaxID=1481888 RepID=A0AAU9IKK3_9CILI|nr:unnamed protein product [Blepharisma stoltei]